MVSFSNQNQKRPKLMNYKTVVLALATVALVAAGRAGATPLRPYLDPVGAELTNQFNQTDPTPANRKLLNSLKSALRLWERPGTPSLAKDTRLLSQLAPALGRTTLSNLFLPLLESATSNYLVEFYGTAWDSSNRLSEAALTSTRTAAETSLDKVFVLLDEVNAEPNLKLATRRLAVVPAKEAATDKLINRAMATVSVTAIITGAVNYSFNSQRALAGSLSVLSGFYISAAAASGMTGYSLNLTLLNVQDGSNTLAVGDGNYGTSSVALVAAHSTSPASTFQSDTGTVHANYDSATRMLTGDFSVSCTDTHDASKHLNITGSFWAQVPAG